MSAPVYQSISSYDFVAPSGRTTTVFDKPAGTVDGDLLVAIISSAQSVSVTTPEGWTLITSNTTTNYRKVYAYKKIAGVSEPSTYTFTHDALADTTNLAGAILRVDNYSPENTVYVYNSGVAANSLTPTINASITPAVSDTLLILACVTTPDDNTNSNDTVISSPAIATSNPTWTLRAELNAVTGGSNFYNNGCTSIFTATRPETTATGNITYTHNFSASDDNTAMILGIQRINTFSSTIAEGVEATESDKYDLGVNIADSVKTEEKPISLLLGRLWTKLTKPSTTWTKRTK